MPARVTIITPSYNQADFLENTIQSVLAQEYPGLEYWIIDGASSDGSRAIIERYTGRLAGWVSEPDHGQAEAINKGFQRASGEYIAWLNSDDLYLPGAIQRGVQALEQNPDLGFVFGDAVTIDARGRPLNPLIFGPWKLETLAHFRIICQPAVFMRRSTLEQAGGLDLTYHTMLDHHLWLRMAQQAPIGYIGGGHSGAFLPLAAARCHPAAKNVAQPEKFAGEILRLLAWIEAQPNLAGPNGRNLRQIRGGAYRLAARYLLDGDRPAAALIMYGRSLLAWPGYAARHAHRMVYAAGRLLGLAPILDRLRRPGALRAQKALSLQLAHTPFPTDGSTPLTLNDWPGLLLEPASSNIRD